MDIEEIRETGLGLPHATERCPFGPDTLALEIGGKMFCLIDLSGEWQFYNLKVDPDYSIELQDRYPEVRPGYHMNKRHWISKQHPSEDRERANPPRLSADRQRPNQEAPSRIRLRIGNFTLHYKFKHPLFCHETMFYLIS